MPLKPGAPVGESIRELRTGKTYSRTKKKFGKKRAQKQSIAIAYKNARKPYRSPKRKHGKTTKSSHRSRKR